MIDNLDFTRAKVFQDIKTQELSRVANKQLSCMMNNKITRFCQRYSNLGIKQITNHNKWKGLSVKFKIQNLIIYNK